MSYAIISVGGKQYRVREGERLLVDRLAHGEGKTFTPAVLLVGGDGETQIAPKDVTVTARVVADAKGQKIRIGKYKRRPATSGTPASAPASRRSRSSRSAARSAPQAGEAEGRSGRRPSAQGRGRSPPPRSASKGMPSGYEELTVARSRSSRTDWNRPMLEAALEYEQAHGKRKGALAALESALAEKEES